MNLILQGRNSVTQFFGNETTQIHACIMTGSIVLRKGIIYGCTNYSCFTVHSKNDILFTSLKVSPLRACDKSYPQWEKSWMTIQHYSDYMSFQKNIQKCKHMHIHFSLSYSTAGGKSIQLQEKTQMHVQSTPDISNSDISNSAKRKASIWIKKTFWLLFPTIRWRWRLFYKSKLPEVQINLHFG